MDDSSISGSQNAPQSTGHQIKKRRSSLLAQHAAKEGLGDIQTSSIRRQIPWGINRAAIIRKEAVASKSGRSMIPTPLSTNKANVAAKGNGGKTSAYSGNRSGKTCASFSANKSSTSNVGNLHKSRSQLMLNENRQNVAYRAQSTSFTSHAGKMRRSLSTDSVRETPGPGSFFATPRTGAKSPRSGKKWLQLHDSLNTRKNTIKVPPSTEKKTLMRMSAFVHGFLKRLDYPDLPTNVQQFTRMTTTDYFNIVLFLGSQYMGDGFYSSRQDNMTKVLTLAQILKYPGCIEKHLKTPTVPHSWPSTLTFLTWLCAVVDVSISFKENGQNVYEKLNVKFDEIILPHYVALYEKADSPDLEAEIDKELVKFREKLAELFTSEIQFSKDELVAMKENTEAELRTLRETPDVSQEVQQHIVHAKEKLNELQARKQKFQNKLAKYKDLAAIRAEQNLFKKQTDIRRTELADIKSKVENQIMSKEEFNLKNAELKQVKHQRKTVAAICRQLDEDLQPKVVALEKAHNKFYEICSKFAVVETYNGLLDKLNLSEHCIPRNPYKPDEVSTWIKTVTEKHEKAELAISKLLDSTKQRHSELVGVVDENRRKLAQLLRDKHEIEVNLQEAIQLCHVNNDSFEEAKQKEVAIVKKFEEDYDELASSLKLKTAKETQLKNELDELIKQKCALRTELIKLCQEVEEVSGQFMELESTAVYEGQVEAVRLAVELQKVMLKDDSAISN